VRQQQLSPVQGLSSVVDGEISRLPPAGIFRRARLLCRWLRDDLRRRIDT